MDPEDWDLSALTVMEGEMSYCWCYFQCICSQILCSCIFGWLISPDSIYARKIRVIMIIFVISSLIQLLSSLNSPCNSGIDNLIVIDCKYKSNWWGRVKWTKERMKEILCIAFCFCPKDTSKLGETLHSKQQRLDKLFQKSQITGGGWHCPEIVETLSGKCWASATPSIT